MQASQNVLLVRPSNFAFNVQTAGSNFFQTNVDNTDNFTIRQKAFEEFDSFVALLQQHGVNVFVFDDTEYPYKPDAIFPNNWVTFHADGTVIIYPMFAHNRRLERREDILSSLKKNFRITNIVDLSKYESENLFLEGTGSIVFDHVNRIAYAAISPRTNKELFTRVSDYLKYTPISFHALDENEQEIYHTNVMMCIGEAFAVVCLESIKSQDERNLVTDSLISTEHDIIEITYEQMRNFAGNMLTIGTATGSTILALSKSAYESLTSDQRTKLKQYCELVPLPIDIIERVGGGSARCMIAEIFLPTKS